MKGTTMHEDQYHREQRELIEDIDKRLKVVEKKTKTRGKAKSDNATEVEVKRKK